MKQTILVRYSEIGTKGKNRKWYEQKLANNIQHFLSKKGISAEIERRYGRILVHVEKKISELKKIFGSSSYSYAIQTPIDIVKMAQAAMQLVELHRNISFRVTCQRLDKTIPMNSQEVQKQLGAEIVAKTKAEVDLENYDVNIEVELIHGNAYVFTERINCFGGLPVNSQGTVLAFTETKQDILAAILMLKRGCTVIPLFEKQQPTELLQTYGAKISCQLNKNQTIRTIAQETKALALVNGQTLNELEEIETELLVLRPLTGINEKEIDELYQMFEMSSKQ
ncbi:hypothetical protein COV18_03555 [Candidatus Woesearchaeota archaeon CG10_big_fil_rev_8_21_14_0_10_37_12]|nr:MAG: hypothetical protein COV18_03555 [Candidatus Woesearchaeota archaeon CG10_big_fil_rev_8_21_14_0_10_37_12]